jgi:hypothetical protein
MGYNSAFKGLIDVKKTDLCVMLALQVMKLHREVSK